ncbi:MAG: DUF2027 domain-containing protein [Bacteroidales bacterium]|nr:DUF2027 domain-containing protein [Bacteroidales bacterium]
MKLQVGDIVRYLNDVGGGVVQKIIDANMVEVLDNEGFLIPVLEKELVYIGRSENKKEDTTSVSLAEDPISVDEEIEDEEIEGNDNPHLYIAFVKNKKKSNEFVSYLINDCNYHLFFVLTVVKDDVAVRLASGQLEANVKTSMMTISYDDISQLGELHFQGIFFKKGEFVPQKMVSTTIPISPVKFYKPGVFTANDFFDEDAYVVDFYDSTKIKIEEEKKQLGTVDAKKIQEAIQEKQDDVVPTVVEKMEESIREIDLHIQELVDDPSHLEPAQMLELQMRTFELELGKAVTDRLEKIVFIHGVGNGILKAKIRGTLDREYPQYFYQDASYQKYKFGATLVYLRKIYK